MTDRITDVGFTFGPAVVERMVRDSKYGVLIGIRTQYQELQVWVSLAGRKITTTKTRARTMIEDKP